MLQVDFLNRYHKNRTTESNKLAYLAGLVDGEGYVKIEKWGTVRLVIGMTAKRVIYWLRKSFGGAVGKPRKLKSGKLFYVWRLNESFEVLKLMILMYPYLLFKDQQVLTALEILKKRLMKHPKFYSIRGLNLRR